MIEDPTEVPAGTEPASTVARALDSRRSVRAFRDTPVPRATVERLLALAARAPSGTNMQPWRVYALSGAARDRLCDALVAAHDAPEAPDSAYRYYPTPLFEPYLGRRRKVGFDLYGLLGIAKGETARMHAQHARNFRFFDAPVGLVFTIDGRLEIGSWLDYGMFLQSIMLAARAEGLDTCPQAAFAPYHAAIRAHLPLAPEEVVVCGMALGYADADAPENGLATVREPVEAFTTFLEA